MSEPTYGDVQVSKVFGLGLFIGRADEYVRFAHELLENSDPTALVVTEIGCTIRGYNGSVDYVWIGQEDVNGARPARRTRMELGPFDPIEES
jgi:hypothetical protein